MTLDITRRRTLCALGSVAVVSMSGCLESFEQSYPVIAELSVANYGSEPETFDLSIQRENEEVIFERSEELSGYTSGQTPPNIAYEPLVGENHRLQLSISSTSSESGQLDTKNWRDVPEIGIDVTINPPYSDGIAIGVRTDLD